MPTARPTATKPAAPTALALCAGCHSYLAENLLGELRCPNPRCAQHGQVAGRVDVVLGALAELTQAAAS